MCNEIAITLKRLGMIAAFLVVAVVLPLVLWAVIAPGMGLAGLGRDLAILSGACAVLSLWRHSLARWGVVLLVALYFLVQVGNAEFIAVFGRPVEASQLSYLLDAVFLAGSVLQAQSRGIFLIGCVCVCVMALCLSAVRRRHQLQFFGGVAVLSIAIALVWQTPHSAAEWVRTGFISQNAQNLVATLRAPRAVVDLDARNSKLFTDLEAELAGDLTGVRRIPPYDEPPNILLIVLEAVSGAFLPDLAARHGLDSDVHMPNLDAFARSGVLFTQFYAHQRQTTRGTYAMLCGELPRFSAGMPKLESFAIQSKAVDCLPRRLAALGYHTEYMQAAPLDYSRKDEALPLMGYNQITGVEAFDVAEVGSAWGPHDGVFLAKAVDRVAALQEQTVPWFLTLLTVGTHHPFNIVPKEFDSDLDAKGRAFEYLDQAFGAFVAEMRARDLFRDTLVIVTSDEASGLEGAGAEFLQELGRNWSFLALFDPTHLTPELWDDPAGQIDVPLTILDLLGSADNTRFQGRSLVRDYTDARSIPAFNNIGNFSFEIGADRVDVCEDNAARCSRYRRSTFRLSDLSQVEQANIAELQDRAQTLITYTDRVDDALDLELIEPDTVILRTMPEHGFLCCQYLSVDAGAQITVTLEIELLSDQSARFVVDAVSQKDGVFVDHHIGFHDAVPGQRLDMSFSLTSVDRLGDFEVRARVEQVSGGTARFRVLSARLQIQTP